MTWLESCVDADTARVCQHMVLVTEDPEWRETQRRARAERVLLHRRGRGCERVCEGKGGVQDKCKEGVQDKCPPAHVDEGTRLATTVLHALHLPHTAATINGVMPVWSFASTFAPRSSKVFTTALQAIEDARCKAVDPVESAASRDAPGAWRVRGACHARVRACMMGRKGWEGVGVCVRMRIKCS